jgi:hypothetical protein
VGKISGKRQMLLVTMASLPHWVVLSSFTSTIEVLVAGRAVEGVGGLIGEVVDFTFSATPNVIVEPVSPDLTSIATGMNGHLRTIGGAFGEPDHCRHRDQPSQDFRLPGAQRLYCQPRHLRGRLAGGSGRFRLGPQLLALRKAGPCSLLSKG